MNIIKKCNTCSVELTNDNWQPSWKKGDRTQCKECSKRYNTSSNPQRMYVDGKYIKKDHPLYKIGKYKSFGDAAFSSFKNYAGAKEGEVYIVTNPAHPTWVKIGMAIDAADRLGGYQTGSPYRDYKLEYIKYFDDRRVAESTAHQLAGKCYPKLNEWFEMPVQDAINIIENIQLTDLKEYTI